MLERTSDLWQLADEIGAWTVITTNGTLNRRGHLVMGAGIAGAAARRFPGIDKRLGALVASEGNVPVSLPDWKVLTWPTKPAEHTTPAGTHPGWQCMARVKTSQCRDEVARTTARSALAIVDLADQLDINGPIVSVRPGCGLGGLDWARVGPWLADRLDDRFIIVTPPA